MSLLLFKFYHKFIGIKTIKYKLKYDEYKRCPPQEIKPGTCCIKPHFKAIRYKSGGRGLDSSAVHH